MNGYSSLGVSAAAPVAVAEAALALMPDVPSPEDDFEVNADGVLMHYWGDDVDVVVPRSVGGVTVTAIGRGAFSRANDYTDTEIINNVTSWLHLRSVVLPETVTSIADGTFQYCQQMETFICYGPLETTGRSTFVFCRSLRQAIFVNGVRMLDNYAFQHTDSLELIYYGDHLDAIGEHAISRSGRESVTRSLSPGESSFVFVNAPRTTALFSIPPGV